MSAVFYRGDALELLKKQKSGSIDVLYANPPYGTTQQWWDSKLPWPEIFTEAFRVLKDDGMLILHCSVPFNYELIRAAPKPPSYSWYWDKGQTTSPLLAKKQPLRHVEEILCWYNKKSRYYPQRVGTEERYTGYDGKTAYVGKVTPDKTKKKVVGFYQTHLIKMKRNIDGFSTRPEEMIELIYKSYCQPGDTVLDFSCYKGLSGVVAKRLGLHWIGGDLWHYPVLLMC